MVATVRSINLNLIQPTCLRFRASSSENLSQKWLKTINNVDSELTQEDQIKVVKLVNGHEKRCLHCQENLTEVSIDDQLSLGHPPLNFSGPPPYTIKHRLLESQTGNSNIRIKK